MQYNVYKVQFSYLTTGGQQHAEREEDHSWCLTVVSTLKPQTEGDFFNKGRLSDEPVRCAGIH